MPESNLESNQNQDIRKEETNKNEYFLSSGNEFPDVFASEAKNSSCLKSFNDEKIFLQTKRLFELQEYSTLCEKRIKQFCPSHNFPVTEADLNNNSINPSDIHLVQTIRSQKFQIQALNNKLIIKENDIASLQNKLDQFQLRYNNLVDNFTRSKIQIQSK